MLFYLHCGRGFNCLYRGWMKNVSQVVLFVVICKTILVLTNCQVTLDTFEHHCSHHTFHWTHVTSLFHGIAARPVHIVTCFRSYDVSRSWGWSPYMHGWSRLTHSPCQHLSVRGESKICMRFSSHHMTIKGCNCSQWPGPRVGKKAFCPLPFSKTGRVAIGHLICNANMPHLTVIMHHNCRLYHIPAFMVIIAFSVWIMNVCQEAHVSLVLPHHICQVTPDPYLNVTTFQSRCLRFVVLGHALSMHPLSTTTENFFPGPSGQTGQGKKRSCPCTLHGQILLSPLSD